MCVPTLKRSPQSQDVSASCELLKNRPGVAEYHKIVVVIASDDLNHLLQASRRQHNEHQVGRHEGSLPTFTGCWRCTGGVYFKMQIIRTRTAQPSVLHDIFQKKRPSNIKSSTRKKINNILRTQLRLGLHFRYTTCRTAPPRSSRRCVRYEHRS